MVERIERARPKTASSETPPQHLEGLSELGVNCRWASEVSNWWPEIGMIQNIEHLSAELQLHRLAKEKVAMDCEVPLSGAESP